MLGHNFGVKFASLQVCKFASLQVGEWASGRVGEWASGRVGEWQTLLYLSLFTFYFLLFTAFLHFLPGSGAILDGDGFGEVGQHVQNVGLLAHAHQDGGDACGAAQGAYGRLAQCFGLPVRVGGDGRFLNALGSFGSLLLIKRA